MTSIINNTFSRVIPRAQAVRIHEIQQLHFDALDDALDTLDEKIASRGRLAMQRIRTSNYSETVIRRETKKLLSHVDGTVMESVAMQIESAALYAQRAADVVRAWQIAGKLKDGQEHLSVSKSALLRARRPGVAVIDAEASLARIKISPLRSPAEIKKALKEFGAKTRLANYRGPKTKGMKVLEKLKKAKLIRNTPEIGLSRRLHGASSLNRKLTEKAVYQGIREASNINKAGRDLISELRKGGTELAKNQRLTKPLKRLKKAGRKLNLMSVNSSDTEALKKARKEWNSSFKQIERIAARNVDRRGGYAELTGIIRKQGSKGLDKALSRWLEEKQAYHAERLVETETSAAYRAREYEQHANKPYIVGFWWRRSASMVKLDTRRKQDISRARSLRRRGKSGKRKTKGRPCTVCPSLADQRFPVEYAREYPRGAHPQCRCWYEWIYDENALANTPITQDDVDWYESLED